MNTLVTEPLEGRTTSRREVLLAGLATAALGPSIARAAPDPALKGMILGPGPKGGPDDGRVGVAAVHKDPASGDWMMWYSCRDATFPAIAPPTLGTGFVALARSKDGVAFRRVVGPGRLGSLLEPGADPGDFDSLHVGVTDVTRVRNEWWMWTFGADAVARPTPAGVLPGYRMLTGIAKSRDGVKWEKFRGRGPGGSVLGTLRDDDVFASWPNGVFDGERVWLYLTLVDQKLTKFRTHCFVSRDGLDWEDRGELRWTQPEAVWQQHGLMTRHVQRNPFPGRKWLMLYTALDADRSRFDRRTIGAASSDDLLSWTPLFPDPIFVPGEETSWDGGGVSAPQLVVGRRDMRLYYFGFPVKARDATLPKGMGLAMTRSRDLRSFVRVETRA